MKTLLISLLLIVLCSSLFAQQVKLMATGSIEFTKTVNVYAIAKKMLLPENVYEHYKNTHNQFFALKSTLSFKDNQTVFIPQINENSNTVNVYNNIPFPFADQRNLVFVNWITNSSITQKQIFEQTSLVEDSVRKIKWKITDEFRDVVGFTCRRANAVILDSIYVVAFYTNEIHTSGGPESFGGLPGMILEVALPHENVIWRATSVIETTSENKIIPPNKGDKVDNKQLLDRIKSAIKTLTPQLSDLLLKDLLI